VSPIWSGRPRSTRADLAEERGYRFCQRKQNRRTPDSGNVWDGLIFGSHDLFYEFHISCMEDLQVFHFEISSES
jgi:hypothetical protein